MADRRRHRRLRNRNVADSRTLKIKYPHHYCKQCGIRFPVKSRREQTDFCSRRCRSRERIEQRKEKRYEDFIEQEDFELRPEEVMERHCLGCAKIFRSSHRFNRVCPACKSENQETSRFYQEMAMTSW